MSAQSLSTLRYEAEERARKGLGWIVAHVDELRPGSAMTRWVNADRARIAAAECAVMCPSFARLAPLEDRVFVVLLADWIERLAVPELIARARIDASAGTIGRQSSVDDVRISSARVEGAGDTWYRPLVLTAGALAESGVRVPDLEMAVRAYGPPTPLRLAGRRPEHALDIMYWWAKLRQTLDAPDVDVACEQELRRLGREPVNDWTARVVNAAILCQSDFGKAPDQVSPYAQPLLERTSQMAIAEGHAELAAECAYAWWCLTQEWGSELRPLLSCVTRAQRPSGAFVPHLRKTSLGVDETERCYHATLAGVLACLALAQLLRELPEVDSDLSTLDSGLSSADPRLPTPDYRMSVAKTANAAQ